MEKFDRQQNLRDNFNRFWSGVFSRHDSDATAEDYYAMMSLSDFIGLKQTLSDINNIITLQLTIKAVEYFLEMGIITDAQSLHMKRGILENKPNSNGYDIAYADGDVRIIAEIKGNIPCVGKNSSVNVGFKEYYGSNQLGQLLNDIRCLLKGKGKAQMNFVPAECGKFLFILYPGDTAISQLISKAVSEEYSVKLLADEPYDPVFAGVNIVPISIS